MTLSNSVSLKLGGALSTWVYLPALLPGQNPSVVKINQFSGRVVIFGRAQDTNSNNVPVDSYTALYEIPCSQITVKTGDLLYAEVPNFINISSTYLIFMLVPNNVSTASIIPLLPVNL